MKQQTNTMFEHQLLIHSFPRPVPVLHQAAFCLLRTEQLLPLQLQSVAIQRQTAPGNDAWEASWDIVSIRFMIHANRVDRDADDADNDDEDDGEAEGHTMNHVHSVKLTQPRK